jgi:hypothetical protein
MGVTTFSLKIAHHMSFFEKVLFISYHNYAQLLEGRLGVGNYSPQDLTIEDSLPFYDSEFCENIGPWLEEEGYTTVIIDDLNSLCGKIYEGDFYMPEDVVSGFKSISEEYNIRIILNVTLEEKENRRADDRPCLREFTWARNIIHDSDQIIALYRPFHYGILEDEHGNSTMNNLELLYLKDLVNEPCSLVLNDWR